MCLCLIKMSDLEEEIVIKALTENPLESMSESETSSSLNSLSSGESDETTRRKRPKVQNYVEEVVRKYDDKDFIVNFRLSRKTTYELIDRLENSNILPQHIFGREKISSEKSVLLTIWYLVNQESFRQVSDRFGVSYSSAHTVLRRVLEFLISLKDNIIKWPTGEQIEIINQAFLQNNGIANVVGVIDGSHIEILKPKDNQESYINRKGYHSLLLQGVVDHEKKFIDVFCGEPGSLHDARLLRKSALYACANEDPDFMGNNFLLGDSAYPNLRWLVTPFKDNGYLTEEQKLFNRKLSSKRVIVENAFGLLKGRFRRLKMLENIDLHLCSKIILGACILHNICLDDRINDISDIDHHDYNQPNHLELQTNNIVPQDVSRRREVFNVMFGR